MTTGEGGLEGVASGPDVAENEDVCSGLDAMLGFRLTIPETFDVTRIGALTFDPVSPSDDAVSCVDTGANSPLVRWLTTEDDVDSCEVDEMLATRGREEPAFTFDSEGTARTTEGGRDIRGEGGTEAITGVLEPARARTLDRCAGDARPERVSSSFKGEGDRKDDPAVP